MTFFGSQIPTTQLSLSTKTRGDHHFWVENKSCWSPKPSPFSSDGISCKKAVVNHIFPSCLFSISKFICGISFREEYQQKHGKRAAPFWSIHTTLDAKNRSPSEDQVFFWGALFLTGSWKGAEDFTPYAGHSDIPWQRPFGEVIIINRKPNEILRREAAKKMDLKLLEVYSIHIYIYSYIIYTFFWGEGPFIKHLISLFSLDFASPKTNSSSLVPRHKCCPSSWQVWVFSPRLFIRERWTKQNWVVVVGNGL